MVQNSIKCETKSPKVHKFLELLSDPEVYNSPEIYNNPGLNKLFSKLYTRFNNSPEGHEMFKDRVMQVLTDEDGPQIPRRLTNVERHLGADDDWCVWEDVFQEDKEVLIPLTDQLDQIRERLVIPAAQEEEVKTLTLTEARALLLFDRLENTDKQFLLAPDVAHFLKFEIREDLRISEKGNASKKARDVMEKLVDMRPDAVFMSKRRFGRKERYIEIRGYR